MVIRGMATTKRGILISWTSMRIFLLLTRAFSRNFTLTVNAGTSLYYRQIRKQSQSTDGLIVAKVYNLGNSLNPVSATNSMNEKAIESVYGSVNVDLFESLFLTFTGRNDWSSTLAKGITPISILLCH